jgi:hypothetical protein
MTRDSSAGKYVITRDTVYFTYQLNDTSMTGSLAPSRPGSAIWKKRKLYPVFNGEDKINRRFPLKHVE